MKSRSLFPENNLNINRQSIRGHELLGVELVPFDYDFKTKRW